MVCFFCLIVVVTPSIVPGIILVISILESESRYLGFTGRISVVLTLFATKSKSTKLVFAKHVFYISFAWVTYAYSRSVLPRHY